MIGVSPGLLAVIRREVRWIRRDPVMRFLLFGVPVIAFVLLGFTFSASVVRGLGVIVVDMDHSATSRLFVQTVDASPGIAIVKRGDDLGAASRAIRAGDSIAAIYLPPDFERDLTAGRRPHAVGFYNTQYFTPGNNASKSISDAINTAAAAVAPATAATPHAGEAAPGLVPEEYVLTNPALNYAAFLLRAVLPTVLHVVIAISAAYAVGSEFRRRSMTAWWEASGHSIAAALVGKLLPYFIVQLAMFALMVAILDVWLGVGFRGDVLLMTVAAMLLIVAYQMIGCLLQLLTRNLALGLSLTGIIVSPAFGYAGVGFPVIAMGWFPRAWGAILPLRWYIQILFDQAARGAPLHQTAEPFAYLCAVTAILMALVWLRCRALARTGFAAPNEQETPVRPGSGIGGTFVAEWRRVLGDRGVLGLFILAPMLYAVFYPQPYLGQLVRNIPIAVVDQDNTDLSRGLIQALGAHGNLSIALRATTLCRGRGCHPGAARVRHRRHSARHGAQRAQGRIGAAADLWRFDLLHPVQPDAAGHPGIRAGRGDRCRHGVGSAKRRRRAGGHRGDGACRPGDGAAVQPDRLLLRLRRAGRLRADPAPDPADGRRDARRCRV